MEVKNKEECVKDGASDWLQIRTVASLLNIK